MLSSVKKRCRVFRRQSFAVHLSKGKGAANNSCGFMAGRCDCPGLMPRPEYGPSLRLAKLCGRKRGPMFEIRPAQEKRWLADS